VKKIIVSVEAFTGEQTITERDETVEEIVEREALEAKALILEAEAEAKTQAKAAAAGKLAALGLTTDDLRALGL
jgi:hypothetical protein